MISVIVQEGRLIADAKLKDIRGTPKLEGTLIQSKKYKDKENVTIVEFNLWGSRAQALAPYLTKGKRLTVHGELRMDSWETQEGQRRSKLYILANDVSLADKKSEPQDEEHSPPVSSTGEIPFEDDIPF